MYAANGEVRGKEAKARADKLNKLHAENNLILPAVDSTMETSSDLIIEKEKKSSKKHKKSKKRKKSKSHKKSSKKMRKKHKHRSSSDDSSDSENDSSSSGTESRHKGTKKSKNKRDNSPDMWVENMPAIPVEKPAESSLLRDNWMTDGDAFTLKTFTKERKEPSKPNQKHQQTEVYDPAKSQYEWNPYWKSNGTGLPDFQKPNFDDDLNPLAKSNHTWSSYIAPQAPSSTRSWQKPVSLASSSSTISSTTQLGVSTAAEMHKDGESTEAEPVLLTDEQINNLASKLIKAELKGNDKLALQLNKQLQDARKMRSEMLTQKPRLQGSKNMEEHVVLTRTDASGNIRPLLQSRNSTAPLDPNSMYGGRSGEKRSKKNVDTHVDGKRVCYFADDDRYNLKQMFEREKYATAAESNLQYAEIVSKHKNPNDDLEDIFADKVRKQMSQAEIETREVQQSIREFEMHSATLENCDRCFDSPKLNRLLLAAMGNKVYLSLPWHVGLQNGHCILSTMQHAITCTQLDEDVWEEMNDFRKALTRMFAAQNMDVIFYEIANNLHKRRHLSVHCIPIPESHGEMLPFYFKKAIEESEQEWSVNKQLISLRKKSLRAAIPTGLPYLWVNFGMESGYAHVIEDQNRFSAIFVQEIIGGMLQLDPNSWRKPLKEPNILKRSRLFAEEWKSFDCTYR